MAKREKRDYYILDIPHGDVTIGRRIMKATLEVLRGVAKKDPPYIDQKGLVLEILARDQALLDYFKKTQDYSYFRKAFQKLVRDGAIAKFKVLGNNKNVYYALPEVLERKFGRAIVATPETAKAQVTKKAYVDGDEEEEEEEDFLEEE